MRKIELSIITIFATMFALLLHTTPAQAQATKTWVSGTGSGSTCSRAAPCATFAAAHTATAAGGEINCVDAGDYYGPVIINKAISIVCDNTQAGMVLAIVTINAGTSDIITLKGLDIEAGGAAGDGIVFNSGAAKVHIRNFRGGGSLIGGILFQPSTYAELYVSDSYITGNSGASFSAGIIIRPVMNGSVNSFISRVKIENNSAGVLVDGSSRAGVAVNAVITDSTVTGSAGDGIQAVSSAGHAAVSVFVDHSVISGNFGVSVNGITASGQGSARARIGDSTIALNVTGVSTTNAGVVQSFKNNRISSNLTDGTPIPAFLGPGGTPLQ